MGGRWVLLILCVCLALQSLQVYVSAALMEYYCSHVRGSGHGDDVNTFLHLQDKNITFKIFELGMKVSHGIDESSHHLVRGFCYVQQFHCQDCDCETDIQPSYGPLVARVYNICMGKYYKFLLVE